MRSPPYKKKLNSVERRKQIRRSKMFGFCFSFTIPILFVLFTFCGINFIVPIVFNNISWIYSKLFTLFCFLMVFLAMWSFFKASYSHPGAVPQSWKEWNGSSFNKPNIPIYAKCVNPDASNISMVYPRRSNLYCTICEHFRPPRTSHCVRCNICVTRMDHHCSFINNCVGSNNHRYFIQFLLYCGFCFGLYIINTIMALCKLFGKNSNDNEVDILFSNFGYIFSLFILPLLAIPFFVFILLLLIGQLFYLTKNMTYVEKKFSKQMKDATKTPKKKRKRNKICKKFCGTRKKKVDDASDESTSQDGNTLLSSSSSAAAGAVDMTNNTESNNNNVKNNDKSDSIVVIGNSNKNNMDNNNASDDSSDKNDDDNNSNISKQFSNYLYRKKYRENGMHLKNYNSGNVFENLFMILGSDILRWFLPIDLTNEMKQMRMENDCHSWDLPPWKRHPKIFVRLSKKLNCQTWNSICCIICRKLDCCINATNCCLFEEPMTGTTIESKKLLGATNVSSGNVRTLDSDNKSNSDIDSDIDIPTA